jgi:serine/threonine protein kinase
MTIASGTQFNHYTILGPIGAGGMGEVYRATDTKLKREVALKVLPSDFATDAERLARFQREAEMLAALNHANIGQIHGIETSDGVTALVMELIEGPTLAERIEQGPLAPDEALNVALQICAALEAAHERGIVHRDLKPANIKLKPDGSVKVLDFGIAKAMEANTSSGRHSPTMVTPAVTESGVIMGTAAYMSPEQARGKLVDARTDIWAFGCVLYEMLTGQPAFGGEDVMTTLARVLANNDPTSSAPHAADVPGKGSGKTHPSYR